MHWYPIFTISFFIATIKSLPYDLTYLGSEPVTDELPFANSVQLQDSGILPAGSDVGSLGLANPMLSLKPDCDPNHTGEIGYNFEKRSVLRPCPEDKKATVPSVSAPGTPGPPKSSEPQGSPGNPEPPEPKVPSFDVDRNPNPFIVIDSTDPSQKRCDYLKQTYVCTGRLKVNLEVDNCYLCTLPGMLLKTDKLSLSVRLPQ